MSHLAPIFRTVSFFGEVAMDLSGNLSLFLINSTTQPVVIDTTDNTFITILSVQTAILLSTASLALLLNLVLFRLLLQTHGMRRNVKFFSQHLSFSIILHVLCVIGQCVYNVVYFLIPSRVPWFCDIFQSVTAITIASIVFFTFVFAIDQIGVIIQLERKKLNTSESSSAWIWTIPVMVWLLSIVTCTPVFIAESTNPSQFYCHFLFKLNSKNVWQSVIFFVLLEFVSCVLFLISFFRSRIHLNEFGINTVTHSLTERFYLFQTMNINRALFPSCLVQVICYSISLILRIFIKRAIPNVAIYLLMTGMQVYVIFHVCHPIFSVRFKPTLAKHIVNNYPWLQTLFGFKKKRKTTPETIEKSEVVVEYRQNPDANIEILNSIWETSKP